MPIVISKSCFIIMMALTASTCSALKISEAVAQCESNAYEKIGLQVEKSASLDYLEKKHELVRVCLVSQGFKFKTESWSSYYISMREYIHKNRGTLQKPSYDPAVSEAENEIQRQVYIAQMSAIWWKYISEFNIY